MGGLKQGQWLRIAGVNVVLKEDWENAINGKQKDNVREEIIAVSGSMKIRVQNRHQSPLRLLNHRQKRMVEVHREERVSEAGVHLGSLLDNRAEITSKVRARDHLVFFWHPPECQFYKTESGCKFGDECSFMHRQVEGQPSLKTKKDGDKSAVAILKDARQLGCVFQDIELPESSSILRRSTKVLGPIRRVQFSEATLRHANIREGKGPIQIKNPHRRSPYAPKFEDRSQEETERQERRARGDA